jgi:hypothetical protein
MTTHEQYLRTRNPCWKECFTKAEWDEYRVKRDVPRIAMAEWPNKPFIVSEYIDEQLVHQYEVVPTRDGLTRRPLRK